METKEDAKEELKRQLREGLVLNDKGKTLTPLLLGRFVDGYVDGMLGELKTAMGKGYLFEGSARGGI
jgi:hypothetical protein